jgi:hypothetical protein
MRAALGLVAVLAVAWSSAVPAAAQALDPASTTALNATLRLLQDPGQRDAVIAGTPRPPPPTDSSRRCSPPPSFETSSFR